MFQLRSVHIFLFFLGIYFPSFAQISIGQWREHLPYSRTIAVAEGNNNKIYCATPYSVFYVDKDELSIHRMSRVTGLSDVNMSTLNFDNQTSTLVLAYENANIDLVKDDQIYNISDIKRKQILGNKRINNITFRNKKAYLSCGFGIVVLDLVKMEIKETWYIGPQGKSLNINNITFDSQKFYAATNEGVYYADINNQNLSNFASWQRDNSLPGSNEKFNSITIYKNQLVVNKSNSDFGTDSILIRKLSGWELIRPDLTGPNKCVKAYGDTLIVAVEFGFRYFFNNLTNDFNAYTYNITPSGPMPHLNDAIRSADGTFWLADQDLGLAHSWAPWAFNFYLPNGPAYKNPVDMSVEGGKLWVASGGIQSNWDNAWLRYGIYSFIDEKWKSLNAGNTPLFDTIVDVMSVAVNPSNSKSVFVGSWGRGLIELYDGEIARVYNQTNSTLADAVNYPGFIGIGGLCFDKDNNLWVTNSANPYGLSVRKANGTWKNFNLAPIINSDAISDLVIDQSGQKWILLPRGNSVMVFDDNATLDNPNDDKKFKLGTGVGGGKLPSTSVLSIAVDLEGYVWLGTSKGIAVIYSPENVFNGRNFDAQQIYIEQEGITQYLLQSEEVTAIAVDGSNRKWFGTRGAGVFLMSEDGTEQIHHFTVDNSPLLSNTIYSIAIDNQSGEVFFGTENGIISFRSTATMGGEKNENVSVFPNPVRETYDGYIAIKGLVQDANFTIADMAGNIVHSGVAEGGQAIWNGKNYSGERVATGVYVVFATNEDGSQTAVAKIMFVH